MRRIFTLIFLFLFLPNLYAHTHFKKVCIANICIQAEVVDSLEARQRGLMFRKKLADDQGMLFVFEGEDLQVFWMKNMNLALDMLWLDNDKKIVEIKENILPCTETCDNIVPSEKARYVLEVNSGFVKKNEIKVRDRVEF